MNIEKSKVPSWFWLVSSLLLAWNLMGVMSFFMHVLLPESSMEGLSEAELALYDQYPLWTKMVFAFAVFGGLLGCIGLLLRKAWSKRLFLISLLSIILQMSHSLMATEHLEVYGPGGAIMPIMIVAIGVLLLYLSNKWVKNGWLT